MNHISDVLYNIDKGSTTLNSALAKRMLHFILSIQTVHDSVCCMMRGKMIIDPLRMIHRESKEQIEENISSSDWMSVVLASSTCQIYIIKQKKRVLSHVSREKTNKNTF